jgi:EmrB/QacA subfamily drug resistance transporter
MAATQSTSQEPGVRTSHQGLALAVIAGAQLMVVLDATIVNIALPHIQQALGFSLTSLTWVLNAYTLAFGGFLLLGGRMGDILGRRRMFIFGILLFAGASLVGGFATSQAWLLASRVVQGIGGAIASPTALSLVTTTFPQGPARNRAFGIYAAVSGAGAAVGLILGGILTSSLSWRWVLFVNVPIGLLLAFAAPYVLPESERKKESRFDFPGALISTAGVSSLVYGFIHAAQTSWSNTVTIAAFLIAIVLLVAFVVVESRTEDPLMPLRLFRDRNRTGSYIVMLATAASLFAMFFFLVQYVQEVWGYSALKAGFAFLPVTGMIVVSAQIASKLVARTGPRPLIAIGAVLLAGGLLWLGTISPTSTYLGTLLPTMLITASGLGLIFVPITLTAVAGVAPTDAGIASAMLNVTQQIGGTIGLSALVTVFAAAFKSDLAAQTAKLAGPPTKAQAGQITVHALAHGWARGFLVASLFAVIALVADLLVIRVEPSDIPAGPPVPAA